VATFGGRFIRKCVAPIRIFSVANGCSAVSRPTEILACEQADITVTLPKPMASGAKADGRFGKQDFVYLPTEDVYRCPAGEKLTYRFTRKEAGKMLRRYWTTA
jgi:hypothetical protein